MEKQNCREILRCSENYGVVESSPAHPQKHRKEYRLAGTFLNVEKMGCSGIQEHSTL